MSDRDDPRQTLNHLRDAVISATMDDEVVAANPAAEALLGYPAGALIGRRLEDIIPERHRAAHREGMARYKASRVPVLIGRVVAVEALAADGTEIPVELSLSAPYRRGLEDGSEQRSEQRSEEIIVAVMRDMRERVPLAAAMWARRDERGLRSYLEDQTARQARLTADAVEAARLAALARLRVLADVGRGFAQESELAEALQRTVELTAEVLGDWAIIFQVAQAGESMRVVAAAHRNAAFAEDMERLSSLPGSTRVPGSGPGVAEVVSTGKANLYSPIHEEEEAAFAGSPQRLSVLHRIGFRSACTTPLRTPSGVLGALVIGAGADTPLLTNEDLGFAEQVADRIGAALGQHLLVQRLAAHERRLARILDELPEGVVVRYPDGTVTANQAARGLGAGDEPWPVAGEWPFLGVLLDDSGQPVSLHELPLPRALRGDVARREYGLRRRDGSLRTILVNAAPIPEEEGAAAVAVYQDISEEKIAARRTQLLASMSRVLLEYNGADPSEPLRQIVDEALDHLGDWCAFHLIGRDGRLQRVAAYHADPSQEERLDQLGVLRGQRWDEGVAARAFEKGEPLVVEGADDTPSAVEVKSDEELRALQQLGATAFVVVPMVADDRPIGMFAVVSTRPGGRRYTDADLTYLQSVVDRAAVAVRNTRLVRAMRERTDELSAVVQSDPSGLVLVDTDGELRQVNGSLLRLLGVDDVVPRSMGDILQMYEQAGVSEAESVRARLLALASDSDARDVLELHFTRGPRPYVQLRSVPVVDRDGVHLGRLFVHIDVTQERELARQRSDFLALAAHELKTPLTPLTMQLGMMERRLQPHAKEQAMATKALRQLDRLGSLVDDLLQYASVEAGRLSVTKSPVDLNDVVSQVIDAFRTSSAAGREIVLHRPSGPVMVEMDRRRIEAVLLNLLENALKYSPGKPRIDVEVRKHPSDATISVSDRGIGIPREDLSNVFERFFRAKNAEATHFSGLGIGLFVSREIVRQHGGEIEVTSVEGEGSSFSVRLPRLVPAAGDVEAPRGRILVVDDDPDILDAASSFLEGEGYDVDRAEDGLDALDRLRRGTPPDLMLLDLMMPRLDGAGLLSQMREAHLSDKMPVVLVSASAQLRAAQGSLDVQGTLAKPFSLDELQAVVRQFVRASDASEG